MTNDINGKGFPRIVRLSELKRGPTRGVSDLAERNGYHYSTVRPLGREFIDRHGLVSGLYNVYLNPADKKKFHCEVPCCQEILQEYYFRIIAAMDQDSEWYTLNSMAREPEVYEALIGTNRKVILCLAHKAPAVILEAEQTTEYRAKVLSIGRSCKPSGSGRRK